MCHEFWIIFAVNLADGAGGTGRSGKTSGTGRPGKTSGTGRPGKTSGTGRSGMVRQAHQPSEIGRLRKTGKTCKTGESS